MLTYSSYVGLNSILKTNYKCNYQETVRSTKCSIDIENCKIQLEN